MWTSAKWLGFCCVCRNCNCKIFWRQTGHKVIITVTSYTHGKLLGLNLLSSWWLWNIFKNFCFKNYKCDTFAYETYQILSELRKRTFSYLFILVTCYHVYLMSLLISKCMSVRELLREIWQSHAFGYFYHFAFYIYVNICIFMLYFFSDIFKIQGYKF